MTPLDKAGILAGFPWTTPGPRYRRRDVRNSEYVAGYETVRLFEIREIVNSLVTSGRVFFSLIMSFFSLSSHQLSK